jgi:hypothetical protein
VWQYALPHTDAGDWNAPCCISLLFARLDWGRRRFEGSRELASPGYCAVNPVVWNHLGTLLTMKSENKKAKQCYQKAVALGSAGVAFLARE